VFGLLAPMVYWPMQAPVATHVSSEHSISNALSELGTSRRGAGKPQHWPIVLNRVDGVEKIVVVEDGFNRGPRPHASKKLHRVHLDSSVVVASPLCQIRAVIG
jgi:hypothetical protein